MTQQHDYKTAADDLCAAYGYNEGQAIEKHWDTIIHALTTLQAITSALPEGVDPVRLVKGIKERADERDKRKAYDSADIFIYQLYREASEVKS